MSYTYAVLDISPAAYAEIRAKLEQAGYQHAFHQEDDGEVIDMHGIAVRATKPAPACECPGYENVAGPYPSGFCRDCGRWYPPKRRVVS